MWATAVIKQSSKLGNTSWHLQQLILYLQQNVITSIWRIFWGLATTNQCEVIASEQHFHMSNATISKVCIQK